MKISSVWKSGKTTKKKNRSVHKPKIRWEMLGLTDPNLTDNSPSIEAIRLEVSSMARFGIGPDTRSRVAAQESKSLGRNHPSAANRTSRRGATGATE